MSTQAPVVPVILAAGRGTRMCSDLPKVLQPLAEKPLLAHVLDTAAQITRCEPVVVLGHGADQVRAMLGAEFKTVSQEPQLGTGHALSCALPALEDETLIVVLYGDVPLVRPQTLLDLLAARPPGGLALLTVSVTDPTGYGRILRNDDGRVTGIVEERDADVTQRRINEVNTGIMAATRAQWLDWLERVDCNNAQGEYYLTDCVALAAADGVPIGVHRCHDQDETIGINDRIQLAAAEKILRSRRATELMRSGASLRDPEHIEIRGNVTVGRDVVIDTGVVLEGDVKLGDRARIGSHTLLKNVTIGQDTEVLSHCVIEQAELGDGCRVGPFARIRPGAQLGAHAHIGNFVEIKNTILGAGSKVNHLSYVGDATVGTKVNVGAGTITANYDGCNKHRTTIRDGASIGSNSVLVAPVVIGVDATIGAGSVVTHDAPDGKLTIARSRQTTIDGWQRPRKKED